VDLTDKDALADELSGLADELQHLRSHAKRMQSLFDVAKHLGAEHTVDGILDHVLREANDVTGADRCSLFLVDVERGVLWTKIAHGTDDTIRVPLGQGIVGECADTCQPIHIPDAYADSRFNQEVDRKSGYTTRNILCVPMLDDEEQCIGVIQALNKSHDRAFMPHDEEMLLALGGIAAVALQNAVLHEEIQALFEGFIKASVYAIEARDPTTSGHSERVATLTVTVAEALNRAPPPRFRSVTFDDRQLRELRFAALLHDFGKVGVHEHVLVKANKLYPDQLTMLHHRFEYARKACEAHYLGEKVRLLEPAGLVEQIQQRIGALDDDMRVALEQLDEFWDFIQKCNRPTVLAEGSFERLADIARMSITDTRGGELPLLTQDELTSLSIRRGTLTAAERTEIEQHVTHTYRFLKQIPWTPDLAGVPDIAYRHHEKLNGRGYPDSLPAERIPVQARIMTITDIYDALTARDRPYKAAIPHQRALQILGYEAKDGAIDDQLLQLFIECKAHESVSVDDDPT